MGDAEPSRGAGERMSPPLPEAGRCRAAARLRVIYYWAAAEDVCYMLYAYAKNEQGDLTRAQIRVLARLVREEFK